MPGSYAVYDSIESLKLNGCVVCFFASLWHLTVLNQAVSEDGVKELSMWTQMLKLEEVRVGFINPAVDRP